MRLLACSDLFVVYDCVQFPRRGWVHRNKLKLNNGEVDWLSLPVEKAGFEEKILNIKFRNDASADFNDVISKFPSMEIVKNMYPELFQLMLNFDQSLCDYNVSILKYLKTIFSFKSSIVFSSSLGLPDSFKGQDRVIKIVEMFGGAHYINSPGGVSLYDKSCFEDRGIQLDFLSEFVGDYSSILQLMTEYDLSKLQMNILEQCQYITTRNIVDG